MVFFLMASVEPCQAVSHLFNNNLSFQSAACLLLPSTWETATAFILRRDLQGEAFLLLKPVGKC